MHRPYKDLPDFARYLPHYILEPRAASCVDGKPVKVSDDDPESTDPALRVELAKTIEGVK